MVVTIAPRHELDFVDVTDLARHAERGLLGEPVNTEREAERREVSFVLRRVGDRLELLEESLDREDVLEVEAARDRPVVLPTRRSTALRARELGGSLLGPLGPLRGLATGRRQEFPPVFYAPPRRRE